MPQVGAASQTRTVEVETMQQSNPWDHEVAARYDTPGEGMFARAAVLVPAVDRLAALAGPGPVLEFAIGTGRVAVPLAARGVRVAGIELSGPMIEQLRKKADEAMIPVVRGDMASADAPPGNYRLVYLVFNTISNLLTQKRAGGVLPQRRTTPQARRPGSSLSFGYPSCAGSRQASRQPSGVASLTILGSTTTTCCDSMLSRIILISTRTDKTRLFRSQHRYVWPSELDLDAQLAGFELEARDADWSGSEFTAESRSHVSIYSPRSGSNRARIARPGR
jgi:hypothetical protein